MARIGFVGASYTSQSSVADSQQTIDYILEAIESGQGQSAYALYPRGGLETQWALGDSPNRAGGRIAINAGTANERSFVIAGGTLYEEFAKSAALSRGAIANDGLPVSMCFSASQLLIVSAGHAYVLTLATNVLTEVTSSLLGTPAMCAFCDSFFIILLANSQQVQASAALDATSWPALSTAILTLIPDQIVGMIVDHRELWLFSSTRAVVYYDAGAQPFPFLPNPSASVIECGLAAPFALNQLDNSIFWLDQDTRGSLIARRANGYQPARVSNHACEFAWQQYATASDAYSFPLQHNGHTFWVVQFPTANATWVYDAEMQDVSQAWTQWSYFTPNNQQVNSQFIACNHSFVFGKHLLGDRTSGAVYQQATPFIDSNNAYRFCDDAGNIIRRVRRSSPISVEGDWMGHDRLQVELESGLGALGPFVGASAFVLEDANGVFWTVTLNDAGQLLTAVSTATAASAIVLQDRATGGVWQLGITTLGELLPVALGQSSGNPLQFPMLSTPSNNPFWLTIANGILEQDPATSTIQVEPQLMLRWSDDGAHTWSNEHRAGAGKQGQYRKRALWMRLGRTRERVYELVVTDKTPWRIIDAYLEANPGYVPQERLGSRLRKMA